LQVPGLRPDAKIPGKQRIDLRFLSLYSHTRFRYEEDPANRALL